MTSLDARKRGREASPREELIDVEDYERELKAKEDQAKKPRLLPPSLMSSTQVNLDLGISHSLQRTDEKLPNDDLTSFDDPHDHAVDAVNDISSRSAPKRGVSPLAPTMTITLGPSNKSTPSISPTRTPTQIPAGPRFPGASPPHTPEEPSSISIDIRSRLESYLANIPRTAAIIDPALRQSTILTETTSIRAILEEHLLPNYRDWQRYARKLKSLYVSVSATESGERWHRKWEEECARADRVERELNEVKRELAAAQTPVKKSQGHGCSNPKDNNRNDAKRGGRQRPSTTATPMFARANMAQDLYRPIYEGDSEKISSTSPSLTTGTTATTASGGLATPWADINARAEHFLRSQQAQGVVHVDQSREEALHPVISASSPYVPPRAGPVCLTHAITATHASKAPAGQQTDLAKGQAQNRAHAQAQPQRVILPLPGLGLNTLQSRLGPRMPIHLGSSGSPLPQQHQQRPICPPFGPMRGEGQPLPSMLNQKGGQLPIAAGGQANDKEGVASIGNNQAVNSHDAQARGLTILQLQNVLTTKNATIAKLTAELADQRETITALRQGLQVAAQLKSLENDMRPGDQADERIKKLKAKVTELEGINKSRKDRLEKAKKELDAEKKTVRLLREELDRVMRNRGAGGVKREDAGRRDVV